MKFIAFLKSKWFWINLSIALVACVVLVFLFFRILDQYTLHGESMTLPDLRGMQYSQAENTLNDRNLRYTIIDSVFVPDQPAFTVLEQNPLPASKVKKNRTVYLTVSTVNPPEVSLPNLTSVSLQQAIRILESHGLVMGERIYVPGLALNSVISMRINGKPVEPGTIVLKGSKVDLVLDDGMMSGQEQVPNLIGQSYENASLVLKAFGLNLGNVSYHPDTKNKSTAVIYRQYPKPSPLAKIPPGEVIDVWLIDRETYEQLYSPEFNDDDDFEIDEDDDEFDLHFD